MMEISDERLRDICKIGEGAECCRYIVVGGNGIACAKKTSLQDEIDHRAESGRMVAVGDNCDGLDDTDNMENT